MKDKIYKIVTNINFLNLITIILIIILPFLLFSGKLFIGGDDTRLYYIYPLAWIKHISYFSWFNSSSLGISNPNQFIVPFLAMWSMLGSFIPKIVLDYLSFSLPLLLGFIYFQKLTLELFSTNKESNRYAILIGSLFYILSPIIFINQLASFLYSVWLIGLIPVILYNFIKYIKTSKFIYIFVNIIWCTLFAQALVSIPWLLGALIPIIIGCIYVIFLFSKNKIIFFIKKTIIFFGLLFLSQSFWLYPFILNFIIHSKNSFGGNVLSSNTADSFTPTVIATATGNVVYPLLNLFHRQIAFDYSWQLKDIFLNFYDKIFFLNIIFPAIIFLAVLNYKKQLNLYEKKVFTLLFFVFLISLFLFTVNIIPFKQLFLIFGHIPGFVMFRNFYDKFALGYIFLYSLLLTFSLVIISRKYQNLKKWILAGVLVIIIINFLPVRQIIRAPLWTTKNIYTNITLPSEYMNFMSDVEKTVPTTTNILSLPLNIAAYTIVKDKDTNNVFTGTSPVKLFTGVNDFSGNLSFPPELSGQINTWVRKRDYRSLNEFIKNYNISYVFLTKNIPDEVKKSYLFDKNILPFQDEKMVKAITNDKVITSSSGNYVLYKTKYGSTALNSKNLYYEKINAVEYKLYIKNIKNPQDLAFLDSYHTGWQLFTEKSPNKNWCIPQEYYPDTKTTLCKQNFYYFNIQDILYSFTNPVFSSSHKQLNEFGNKWIIDPKAITDNFNKAYYTKNHDGTINIEITMYFVPQNYFYFGSIISIITIFTICSWFFYLFVRKKGNSEK